MAEKTHDKEGEHAGGHGIGRYVAVWLILLFFTMLTVVTGHMNLGAANIFIALAIAIPFVLDESPRSGGRLAAADAFTSTLGMAALVYGFIHAANPAAGWSDRSTAAPTSIRSA